MSIRQGLLALLVDGPRHGYQLRQEFETRTGATWPLNIGQVYTTLGRLVRDDLVEVAGDGEESQKLYAITPRGREVLDEWFATPVELPDRPRDELAIKLAMAAVTDGVDVAKVVQAQRSATVRALQDYARLKAHASADADIGWLLVLDSLAFQAEAEIRWLDVCEQRLARAHAPRRTRAAARRSEAGKEVRT